MQNWLDVTIGAALLGSALISGVFFAFSTFVMQALAKVEPANGILTMQWINRTVINPWFFIFFVGTTVLSLGLAIYAGLNWQLENSAWLLCGALLYLLGTILVTGAGNVPLNEALARVEAQSAAGQSLWARYLRTWTLWNHVRTIAALLAAGAFLFWFV